MTHAYRLSYMHVYLLSQFPSSFSLSCGGLKRRRWRKRQCWVLSYLEESSLKWATVIHQLRSSPERLHESAHSLEIPQDSPFLYLRFILFVSLHISLSVFLSAVLLLWPLAPAMSLVSSSDSVCGDDSNLFHCQDLTTETLHTAWFSFLCFR